MVSEDTVRAWLSELANHGRWGPEDEAGTLNHIGPPQRRHAAALVELGHAISCAFPVDPDRRRGTASGSSDVRAEMRYGPYQHPLSAVGWRSAYERVEMTFHGQTMTHVDAPAHFFWQGRGYNGLRVDDVTDGDGALRGSVGALASGCVARGVLLDVATARGVDWLEPGEAVHRAELERVADAAGIEPRQGDVVLVRTGHGRRRQQGEQDPSAVGRPGLHADCLPWLFANDVAVLGGDTANDAIPSGYPFVQYPIHVVGITAMGLWLIDNCNLEPLAAACGEAGRYEFQLVLAPLDLRGGTGSPLNPIAVL